MILPILLIAASAVSLVEEGRALYNANRFVEARTVLRKAVNGNPADAQARFWLAFTHLALDEQESALRNFEAIENPMGEQPEYLYAISETYTRCARRLANDLVALGDVARAHQHLAYRYHATGDWKTAVDELRIAAHLRPKLAGVHMDAAEILWEQKRYDEAARELEAELAVAPLSFSANLRYGQYLVRGGRHEEAVAPLVIAVRYRKYSEAVQLLAFNYEQMNKPERALAALNGGAAVFPSDANVAAMRAQLLAKHPELRTSKATYLPPPLRERATTVAALRGALAHNPRDEDALYLLSQAYSELGAAFFGRLEKLAPGSARVLQIRGLNAESVGDFAEAEACYRKVIESSPRFPNAHYTLGHLLRRLGRDADAEAEFRRELEIDPHHYLAYFELGAARLQQGEAQEALPMLEKSVSLRPGFHDPKVELAKAYIQLKRAKEAIALLLAVLPAVPEHPTAHYLLSRAYLLTGNTESARREVAIHQEIVRKQGRLRRSMAQRQQDEAKAGK